MSTDLDRRRPEASRPCRTAPTVPPEALGLVLATLEALLGRRGLHQLRPRMGPDAFVSLVVHVDARTFGRSSLGQLRLQMPSRDAVEATARISLGSRWLACTIRLDRADQWRCTELAVIGSGGR